MMDAVNISETSVNFYQMTRHNVWAHSFSATQNLHCGLRITHNKWISGFIGNWVFYTMLEKACIDLYNETDVFSPHILLYKIRFNIIFLSLPASSKSSFPFRFYTQNNVCVTYFLHAFCKPHPSYLLWFNHLITFGQNYILWSSSVCNKLSFFSNLFSDILTVFFPRIFVLHLMWDKVSRISRKTLTCTVVAFTEFILLLIYSWINFYCHHLYINYDTDIFLNNLLAACLVLS